MTRSIMLSHLWSYHPKVGLLQKGLDLCKEVVKESTRHSWDCDAAERDLIVCPGARPADDISIEFEIRPKFGVL